MSSFKIAELVGTADGGICHLAGGVAEVCSELCVCGSAVSAVLVAIQGVSVVFLPPPRRGSIYSYVGEHWTE